MKLVKLFLILSLFLLPMLVPFAEAGMIDEIKHDLVYLDGSAVKKFDGSSLDGVKRLGIYFSAHWCPPCRRFTPKLVEFYNKVKPKHPDFEIIFVSSDHTQAEMEAYMKEAKMPWPAVIFLKRKANPLYKKYAESGIPNLVFIDKNGEILASTFVDGKFEGPHNVIETMRKALK